MAKQHRATSTLIQWIKHVPTADVQDPLGTSLRGSTRLANRLLFCITSITPRARYFSFIPWCVLDFNRSERGKPYALGLRKAVFLREHALTLACIAHHDGQSCQGGSLVGSDKAILWYKQHAEGVADFRKLNFVKNPALGAYLNSLANLGIFVTEDDRSESEETDEPAELTSDDLELSVLGQQLAEQYDAALYGVEAVTEVASSRRRCPVPALKAWGYGGGLCELADVNAPDRELLRDIFFQRIPLDGKSHSVRRQSLLLLMSLARTLSDADWSFDQDAFNEAVYYGELRSEEEVTPITLPPVLADIGCRWRMFYFHYYMAVALEGLFSWLVMRLDGKGLAGESFEELVASLDDELVQRDIEELIDAPLPKGFGRSSPRKLFGSVGIDAPTLTTDASKRIDQEVRSTHHLSEYLLDHLIRDGDHRYSPTGFAVSLLLMGTLLARYKQWETTPYGQWLANGATDPYLDLVPPLVQQGMERRFGDWWNTSWRDLGGFMLHRFVIQQHQAMSYEKTATGNRCLLQVDGNKVMGTGTYDKIGIGNARFRSAVQVLTDLGLFCRNSDKEIELEAGGSRFLDQELAKETTR